jgi:hypothetical protein
MSGSGNPPFEDSRNSPVGETAQAGSPVQAEATASSAPPVVLPASLVPPPVTAPVPWDYPLAGPPATVVISPVAAPSVVAPPIAAERAHLSGLGSPSIVGPVVPPITRPASPPAGDGGSIQPLPYPSMIPDRRHAGDRPGSTWGAPLFFACLSMGLLAAFISVEWSRLANEQDLTNSLKTAATLAQSRDEDLGRLLADPNTRVVKLVAGDGSSIHNASAAWNPRLESGFLFCDQLPVLDAPAKYHVWLIDSDSSAISLGALDAKPGVSVYTFTAERPAQSAARIEITSGDRQPGKAPLLTGTF